MTRRWLWQGRADGQPGWGRWRARWRRTAGARRGQSLVETALLMPVLVLILLGTIDVGRVFIYYVRLTDAVNSGALYGANVPNNSATIRCRTFLEAGSTTSDNCTTFTEGGLGMPGTNTATNFVVTVTCYQSINSSTTVACSDAVSGDAVQVVGTYAFRPLTSQILRFFPATTPLKKTVRMTI